MPNTTSISNVIISFVAVLFSLCVHEASHAAAIYWLSGDTIVRNERVTLNPIAHIDIVGTVIFPILGLLSGGIFIGWAKPVMFNPSLLTRRWKAKISTAIIAAAGPLSNVVLSIIFLSITTMYIVMTTPNSIDSRLDLFSATFTGEIEVLTRMGIDTERAIMLGIGSALVRVNIILATFNMIPAGPLDGAGVLGGFLPDRLQYRYNNFRYSRLWFVLLLLLIYIRALPYLLTVIATPMEAMLSAIARLILVV